MNFKCPICNKSGLPDYTVTQTICPQCNSDLKPFMLLHFIAKPNKRTIFGFIGISLIAIVATAFFFNSHLENGQIANDNTKTINQLQDSIHNLQPEIIKQLSSIAGSKASEKEITIQYKIKQGDYLSKIAQFFYNDWRMYKKIETDNNLNPPYILNIGQPLIIKLKQK
jgi:hypothetical protein